MALAPQHHGRRRVEELTLRAAGDLRRNHLAWSAPRAAAIFQVHARRRRRDANGRLSIGTSALLAETGEPTYVHTGLDAHGETWEYVVRALDAWGVGCGASAPVRAASTVSVTVTGRPIASVGTFDGTGPGLALARFAYVRYQSTFPADVDFVLGRDDASTGWSWLQPGPDDAWAGRRGHRFRLHFDLESAPREDLDLALWLADRHPTRAAAAGVLVNGNRCDPLLFVDEPDQVSDGDPVVPGRGAGPAYVERPLPAAAFGVGENVLEIVKDQGSWIAYDGIGVFARP